MYLFCVNLLHSLQTGRRLHDSADADLDAFAERLSAEQHPGLAVAGTGHNFAI